ncbi:hypothetical protein AZI86_06355 [Bdellovibrio bacteriovorus]|uniref:NAD(+)--protein-arginine ADP-ribosyltransferase n=1 Tax=Bdellovibrio bacteriovorus TaxID=959 RepID=A0A150WQ86_BDEBC|nr:hypothetical protein [Bdellovibrio bacteriovorus]KYG66663.1 hypothetical protein AZI86_06355 [Bdellovibrio bacteriovorus]
MDFFFACIRFEVFSDASALSAAESLYSQRSSISFSEAETVLADIGAGSENELAQQKYSSTMKAFMGTDVMTWIDKNPELYRAINDYVDDPPDGSDPLWETTNAKLNRGKALSAREADFKNRLEKALAVLPKYNCICFRGGALSKKGVESYREGSVITMAGFYSTSIDPNIAYQFARQGSQDSFQTIFVINVHSGSPMSSFHQFHWTEFEVLMKAGEKVRVEKVLMDQNQKKAIIFLEQI